MLVIKTTKAFDKIAKKVLSNASIEELFDHLLVFPESGDVISGTGGVRKLRWQTGKNNKGKQGGARVIYHYHDNMLVILITLYTKSGKSDLTQGEKKDIKELLPVIISQMTEDK